MAKEATVTLRLEGMPEMLWTMRHAMANLLRSEAEGEPEFVRRKLYQCAEAFETGISEDSDG